MADMPLVSILIPTFNRCHLLQKALRSALSQSYSNLEVIVCDNASTDGTESLMQDVASADKRVRYVRNSENIGPIANWRKCLDLAVGHFCIILSDDDFFLDPDYVSEGIQLLQRYGAGLLVTDCVLGSVINTATNLGLPEFISGNEFFLHFWEGCYQIPVISCIFDATIARQCEPFTDSTILYSDIELWLKMMLLTDVVYRPFPSVYYRFHNSNIVSSLSLDAHKLNIRFIDRVYDFARSLSKQEAVLSLWRSRMYRHYVLNIVLDECIRKGISAERFAAFGAELGRDVALSYRECFFAYYKRRASHWVIAQGRRAKAWLYR
jgi:glycosyltransferase involved in cell wall biosynthesis